MEIYVDNIFVVVVVASRRGPYIVGCTPARSMKRGDFHRVCPKGSAGEVSGVCGGTGTGGAVVWGAVWQRGQEDPWSGSSPGPVRQQVLTVAGPKLAEGPPSTSG